MLADDIARALPELRLAAESLMLDEFTAYAPDGYTTDADGYEVPAWADQGTTIGKVSGRGDGDTNARMVTVGDVERPVIEGGIHLPLAATLPAIGWEYECTHTGPASDPALLGRRWRVVDVPAKSHATARRLDVVEV